MKSVVLLLALASCTLAVPAAMAQSDLGLKKLGVAAGYISPEDLDGTFSIGVFADHGMITPNIGLESRLDYWSSSENAFGMEASISDIAIGARGKYYFPVSNPKLHPFAGAGVGLHFVTAEVTIPAQFGFPEQSVSDSSTELGLDFGGGLATNIGPRTDLLSEMWFGVVDTASTFSLRIGLAYRLGM